MPTYRLRTPEAEAYCKRCVERFAEENKGCAWLSMDNDYCCDILDFDRKLQSHWDRTTEDIKRSKEYEDS